MTYRRPWKLLALGLSALTLTSCEAPGPTPLEYGVRSVPKRDRAAMLDSVEAALVKAGFQIERRDAAAGVITTLPNESKTTDQSTGSSLRSRGRTRRVGEVRLQESGGAVRVYCKVLVQELATAAYGLYNQDRATSDSPGENTAINRDAGTTEKQNTVWRTIRREKLMERAILDDILGPGGETK